MRNETKRTVLIFMLLLVGGGQVADLLSTVLPDPTLAREWDPLVRRFDWDWRQFTMLKVAVVVLAGLGYLYYWRHHRECYPSEARLGFEPFRGYLTYGRHLRWWQRFYKLPRLRHGLVIVGFFWAWMTSLTGYWLALENVLGLYGLWWSLHPPTEPGHTRYHLAQGLLVALVALAGLYVGCYRDYLRRSQAAAPEAEVPAETESESGPGVCSNIGPGPE